MLQKTIELYGKESKMAEKLKKSVIYLYGLPSFGFQIFIYVELMFFSAFLTDAVKMPVALAGSVLMITSIFDLIWVPVAGIISNCCKFTVPQ